MYLGLGNSNVSRRTQAFIFHTVILGIFDAARQGIDVPCIVIIEEAQSSGLLTPAIGRAMLEIREAGVEIRLITQNIFALSG
jgi:hypothetical protein